MRPRADATTDDEDDRFGFDDTSNYLGAFFGKLLPERFARKGVRAAIRTDRDSYRVGDPVHVTIEFRNPFPFAVALTTPTQQQWGWTVDGLLEASDERRYMSDTQSAVVFDSRERKVIERHWDGRFKRSGDPTRWVDPDPGEYELAAFLANGSEEWPRATTTIRFEPA